MSTALMVRDGDKMAAKFSPDALAVKENALAVSGIIARVRSQSEYETAVAAQSALSSAIRAAEKSRKEFKEPVLEYGRQIDAIAKEYKAELEAEELRVGKLAGDWQQLQIAKQKAEEAARLLELQKIEEERQAEIRRVAQEEARKLAEIERAERERKAALAKQEADAARAAREASNAAEREKAEKLQAEADAQRAKDTELQRELDRQKELAAAESLKAMEATQERFNAESAATAERVVAAPAKVAGTRVVEDYEITISDVHTLARCHPNCVKITPLNGEIKALLKMGVKVQGVTFKEVVSIRTASPRQSMMIDA